MAALRIPEISRSTELERRMCADRAACALHPAGARRPMSIAALLTVATSPAERVRRGELHARATLRPVGVDHDARHDGGRSYARLVDSPELEVWPIEWGPATNLELHDHGGSAGGVELVSGELVEIYTAGDARRLRSRSLHTGDQFGFGSAHVHELRNPTATATSASMRTRRDSHR